jgi:hypothetical protein
VVEGVEGVEIGPRGELGVERQRQQAAVTGVVDLLAEVGEDLLLLVLEAVVEDDPARLLGGEYLAVRGERDGGRFLQVAKEGVVAEARGQGRGPGLTGQRAKDEE